MRSEATFLGAVRRVLGAKVLVELSPELPSASPIIDGRLYRLGQIGSFLRIPLGFVNLYGVVSMIGAAEQPQTDPSEARDAHGQRWLEVQLVGESVGDTGFQRGVSVYPTLDDEVHVVTQQDLALIYAASGDSMVPIGKHSASDALTASVDIDKIVSRHAAIVGSTGSGKSNTVAAFLKSIADGSFPNAQVIVIDPHGEYRAAFAGASRVFSIGDDDSPLVVPYWALSFDELAWFLVDRKSAAESMQDATLRGQVADMKRASCGGLKAGPISPDDITVDSPVPFSIRDLWYSFDRAERVTYRDMPRTVEALTAEGNAQGLVSAVFEAPGAGSSPPFKPQQASIMGSYVSKITGRLKDKRFDFLLNPGTYDGVTNDISDLVASWMDHDNALTVLDLAGVPFEVIDLVVGVVTRIIFESMFWGRELDGVGRQRPVLMVFEEAHTYLPRGEASQFIVGYANRAVRRVLKEGRKYGLGAVVVSQRPSELDETILSQCGTFFALRLSNADDQSRVKSTVPDALAGLIDLLPALRTGEALILGEAMQIPSRVRIPLIEPRPASNDPAVSKWWRKEKGANVDYDAAVTGWRVQRTPPKEPGNGA